MKKVRNLSRIRLKKKGEEVTELNEYNKLDSESVWKQQKKKRKTRWEMRRERTWMKRIGKEKREKNI